MHLLQQKITNMLQAPVFNTQQCTMAIIDYIQTDGSDIVFAFLGSFHNLHHDRLQACYKLLKTGLDVVSERANREV